MNPNIKWMYQFMNKRIHTRWVRLDEILHIRASSDDYFLILMEERKMKFAKGVDMSNFMLIM